MAASVSTKLAYWLATTLEVRQPSTNSALFLEIITTLLELQQFFPSRLYSNSLLLGQSVVDNHPLFKVTKILDLQMLFLELNTPIFLLASACNNPTAPTLRTPSDPFRQKVQSSQKCDAF